MPKFIITISISAATVLMVLFPQINAGSRPTKHHPSSITLKNEITKTEDASIVMAIYDSIKLKKFGLGKDAFTLAWRGYQRLLEKGKIVKEGILTICDFSQSSRRKRLYLIDLNSYTVVLNTYVAHGKRSGGEYASRFSNRPESHQSSLGFYITRNTYWGEHGLSLVIDGMEKGINCKAEARKIVVHGSRYVGDNYLRGRGNIGRSFGCPAVPKKHSATLINTIKNGSCLFIYHPSKDYKNVSALLKEN